MIGRVFIINSILPFRNPNPRKFSKGSAMLDPSAGAVRVYVASCRWIKLGCFAEIFPSGGISR